MLSAILARNNKFMHPSADARSIQRHPAALSDRASRPLWLRIWQSCVCCISGDDAMNKLGALIALTTGALLLAECAAAAEVNPKEEIVKAMSRCFGAKKFNAGYDEVKDPLYEVEFHALTRADRANGIAAKGMGKVSFIAYRLRDKLWFDRIEAMFFTLKNDGSLALNRGFSDVLNCD
jgi:hypothetical protein